MKWILGLLGAVIGGIVAVSLIADPSLGDGSAGRTLANISIFSGVIVGAPVGFAAGALLDAFVAARHSNIRVENAPRVPRPPTVIGAKCAVCTKTILMQMDGAACECGVVFHNECADGPTCPICNISRS